MPDAPPLTALKLLNIRREWMTHPNIRRCTHSLAHLIGATNGEGGGWVKRTEAESVPEFYDWWKSLPEADPYDRPGALIPDFWPNT
jgi:hypothetical protein